MKKTQVFTLVLLVCLFFSGQSFAGVFDDVHFWWHLDYDANGDGIAQLDELRDQRDWGTISAKGSSGYHAYSIATPDQIDWTNGVPITSGGLSYGDMAIEFQPATNIYYTYTTNSTYEVITTNEFEEVSTNLVYDITTNTVKQCWPEVIRVNNAAVKSNCTIMCRFRWDGPAMNEWDNPGWIVNNALAWSHYRGWMFGPRLSNGKYYLSMYIAQEAQYYFDVPLVKGKWYEAAAVLRDNGYNDTVTFYLWPEDYWEVETAQNEYSGLTWRTYTSHAVTNAVDSYEVYIGGESQYWNMSNGQNVTKSFRGSVNYIAMWDRDLSHNEILEAFGYYSPIITIGIDNDNVSELIVESEADSIYDVGDPWHTMRRAVTVSRTEATIRANLTALQAQQNYCMHVDISATENGADTDIELIVNNTTNETITVKSAQDIYWDIPSEQLVTGINTFTLRYVGGESNWASWDWMEIFGSWQVGLDDNTQSDFVQESKYSPDYFISDPVWKDCRRAVTVGHNVQLNFTLSEEMLNRHIFTYSSEIIAQGGTTPPPPHPLNLQINGNVITNGLTVPDYTKVTFPDIKQYLIPGNNSIVWTLADTGGWSQFDFHKVEMALPPGPPKGTLLMLR